MVNEVTVLGVVASVEASSNFNQIVVLTGVDPNGVKSGSKTSVVLDVQVSKQFKVQTGSLVFLRGALKTKTVVVEGERAQQSFIAAEFLNTLSFGPFRVSGPYAQSVDGKQDVILFNYVKLIGLLLYDPREHVYDDNSVAHFSMVATAAEEKIEGKWVKSTDYHRVVAWNMKWINRVVKALALVEVEGHLQIMRKPMDTAGHVTVDKADVIAHDVQVRTDWLDHAINRWQKSPAYVSMEAAG